MEEHDLECCMDEDCTCRPARKPERKAPAGTICGPTMDTCWQTPPELIVPVRAYFNGAIPLDVATTEANPTGAKRFWTEKDDALSRDWLGGVFVNPPYGRVLRRWLDKIHEQSLLGCTIFALLPCARWEQMYFQRALDSANMICLIRSRVAFIRPSTGDRVSGNPYANMFVGWNVYPHLFTDSFRGVGSVLQIEGLVLGPEKRTAPQGTRRKKEEGRARTDDAEV